MEYDTTQLSSLLERAGRYAVPLLATSLLAACGSSSDSSVHEDHHIESAGRLAMYDVDASAIKIFDLDDMADFETFALTGEAPRLYPSPDYRYATIIQRGDSQVSFLDSGLYTEDHDDHLHDVAESPMMLNFTLNGNRPTHYNVNGELSLIFNDASEGLVSSISIISEESLENGEEVASLELTNNMHGAARLIDDQLFVTYRSAESVETTLPEAVERYSFTEGAFNFEERYETLCPGLHGSANNENFLVFGCTDGVLSINLQDESYPATKIANPDSLLEDKRVGTVVAHEERNELIGIAGDQFFLINPNSVTPMIELSLPLNAGKRILQGMDAHGERLYVLTDNGALHVYDAENNWELIKTLANVVSISEDTVSALASISAAEETLFVFDRHAKKLVTIDLEEIEKLSERDIDFDVSSMVWLGLAEHEHEHE
ncbi:MAG: hypothetical protein ACI9T9_000006 [Oleiphilaceae bacterium]|jgi:hypothetical protein